MQEVTGKYWTFSFFTGCSARVDLAFIIDGSGSIEHYGRGNFRRCLNFVKAIVSRFSINNGQTRIGVVLFSSRPRLIFDFRRYRSKNQILNAINRIRYPRGGTKTGYAMRYCYSRVFRYARRGVRKVNYILYYINKKKILDEPFSCQCSKRDFVSPYGHICAIYCINHGYLADNDDDNDDDDDDDDVL